MAKAKGKSTSSTHVENSERQCKKGWKKRPGVAPGAHNGHSVGGYSKSKYGPELAAQLADKHTTKQSERRQARHRSRAVKAA